MPQQLPESRGTRNFQSGVSCLDIRASCLSEHMERESSTQAIHASWELVQNVAKLSSAECIITIITPFSDTHHETTIGKNGVKVMCMIMNHADPSVIPINAPQITWVLEWYNRYTLLDNGIHSVSSAARAKRDSIPSSGLSGDAIVIVVLEDATCLARRLTMNGRRTRTGWTTGEDELEGREKESRIYTCDYEIVAIALSSTIAIACSITLVAVAGIDLAVKYNCSTNVDHNVDEAKAAKGAWIHRRPTEVDKATKRIVVKVAKATKANSTMCFLFSVSCCLFLVLLIKKARGKQQETENKEHIVELA
ncbi:hypothetical protein G5I_10584 [Acromyrmex echinatior]|uniref:Uncharacterized protein n=1 Tax=Acromyrmex echinatior TaxID=103372 RepID=F4WXA0_ACREC|nr:hypothetical protein G5I_10584 [Acromyrmex echinatior]